MRSAPGESRASLETKSYLALASEILADVDPNSSHALIRDMVGSGQRVLDVGCGPGNLAKILRQAGNVVIGIDADPQSLRAAQDACERTISADLDEIVLSDAVGDDRFDVIVFADVLEHVRDAARLLAASKRVLRDRGSIVVSIPNVAHGAVRLALLRGRFGTQQLGILDDTHLPFYTRESIEELLTQSGFIPTVIERTTAPVFEESDLVPRVKREDFDRAIVDEIMADSEAQTLQFVIRAAPVDDLAVLAALRAKIAETNQLVGALRAQLAARPAARSDERDRAVEALARADAVTADLRAELEQARTSAQRLASSQDQALAQLAIVAAARELALRQLGATEAALGDAAAARADLALRLDATRTEFAAAAAARDDALALFEAAKAENAAVVAGLTNELRRFEAALREAESRQRALTAKIRAADEGLAIERATRRDVADAFDVVGRIALYGAVAERSEELARLRARSEADDARLRAARFAVRVAAGAPAPLRPLVATPDVCARIGRHSVEILTTTGHAPPRTRWIRLRGLLSAALRGSPSTRP